MKFSKYEFNNKLLDGVILLRVTLGVTWNQPIYIYIYIFVCAQQKWGWWAGLHLGSQSICDVGFGFPTLGSS